MSTPKTKAGSRVTAHEYQGSPKGIIESDKVKIIRKEKYVWVRWDDADKLFYGKAILEPLKRLSVRK